MAIVLNRACSCRTDPRRSRARARRPARDAARTRSMGDLINKATSAGVRFPADPGRLRRRRPSRYHRQQPRRAHAARGSSHAQRRSADPSFRTETSPDPNACRARPCAGFSAIGGGVCGRRPGHGPGPRSSGHDWPPLDGRIRGRPPSRGWPSGLRTPAARNSGCGRPWPVRPELRRRGWRARAPAAARIAQRHHRHRLAQGLGVDGRGLEQPGLGLGLQQAQHGRGKPLAGRGDDAHGLVVGGLQDTATA